MLARERAAAPSSREEAQAQINDLLRRCAPGCTAEFYDDALKIRDSWRVRRRKDRLAICEVFARSGLTHRTAKNLSSEWLLHNIAYALHVGRRSARDVDLDYGRNRVRLVDFCTKALEILHLH